MSERAEPLEPIVAHGARMSWAGVLRPGDEFPLPLRSQLAVMTSESVGPLKRHFGSWSAKYRRFTANLSTPRIRVVAAGAGEKHAGGIPCVLHWVRRRDLVSAEDGVCKADGWPGELWRAFLSSMDRLPEGTVCEKLRVFVDSDLAETAPIVAEWRRCLKGGRATLLERSWLPVPATLGGAESRVCVISWAPGTSLYSSLSAAVASDEGKMRKVDPASQARYYAECVLASLHGVDFRSPGDLLKDRKYAKRAEVRRITDALEKLEKERLADPRFGPLDTFGSK